MPHISFRDRQRPIGVIALSVLTTLMCMAMSVAITAIFFPAGTPEIVAKALVATMIVPVFIGAPLYFLLFRHMRRMAYRNLRLDIAARHDRLTACLNRTAFRRWVSNALSAPTATRGALLIVDADHFKTINDRFGHAQGDQALRLIAECVRSVTRGHDQVGRIGGEEFGVFLLNASEESAHRVAERIRSAVRALVFAPDGSPVDLSVSVGGTAYEGAITMEPLFADADARLYSAKSAGRDRVDIGAMNPATPISEPRAA